jgi:hypothetical protein
MSFLFNKLASVDLKSRWWIENTQLCLALNIMFKNALFPKLFLNKKGISPNVDNF